MTSALILSSNVICNYSPLFSFNHNIMVMKQTKQKYYKEIN